MLTFRQFLDQATQQLITMAENPKFEAELLLCFVLKKTRTHLHSWPETNLTPLQTTQLAELVQQRMRGVPMAYLLGEREFWSLTLSVNTHTLIPRPETELLVESLLEIFPQRDSKIKVAELGTGSGAIALALAHERPNWQVYASDISKEALKLAQKNAERLQINTISFLHGSWCQPLPHYDFDVILSNPPYLAESELDTYKGLQFEPKIALVSGRDGLDAIREISEAAKNHLRPGGYLMVEHGFTQGKAVKAIFKAKGYQEIQGKQDLSAQDRLMIGRIYY